MWTLFTKELKSFLTSLIGYIAIFVFLIVNGLFLFVVPTQFSILDSKIASLDSMFFLAPYLFLFLISAITMKMFAEERRSGTIEILLTKPLSDLSIIVAKLLSSWVLVLLSILPTFIYMICVYQLGSPIGNLDIGSMFGSYIGLLFLGLTFCSIGVFCSCLTNNQIVAFILSMVLCFLVYNGFYFISLTPGLGKYDLLIQSLGINYHYESISRGVVDTRDIIYFLSATVLFVLLTKISLQSRNWQK